VTFRSRVQLAFVGLAVVAIGGLALGVREEMTHRLTGAYQRRVTSLVGEIHSELTDESQALARALGDQATALADDNRFRLALSTRADRGYVLDYAGRAMRLAGLDMLQVQDSTGRILSSGQFRNEFDRIEPEVPRLVAGAPAGLALVQARTPQGSFLALARADSARVGRSWLWVVGGRVVDSAFLRRLTRDQELSVTLDSPGGMVSSSDSVVDTTDVVADALTLPFVEVSNNGGRLTQARLIVSQPMTPILELRHSVDRWSLGAGLLAVAAALLLGTWASAWLSRPLAELADEAARVDLTRLDVDFARRRTDEVGSLARVLGTMTERLRRGAQQLREAERRAAVGDVARQVNHDIKNGLAPIRNVLRHLAEVADHDPARLPEIFRERKGTLDSGVQYLETLAQNYARLTPKLDGGSTELGALLGDVGRGAATDRVRVRADLPADLPPVRGDAVVVRRILENLVSNGVDAVAEGPAPSSGEVVVAARAARDSDGAMLVCITVRDTGPGMTKAQLERAFEDFYTTKSGGTGLGLSVVRRLVADLGGALKVQTAPGAGTTIEVSLPAAPTPEHRGTPSL
jgi:signal transduction histidine kinase